MNKNITFLEVTFMLLAHIISFPLHCICFDYFPFKFGVIPGVLGKSEIKVADPRWPLFCNCEVIPQHMTSSRPISDLKGKVFGNTIILSSQLQVLS